MGWIQDLVEPKTRAAEEFYRNRWQHDAAIRSTHGVNCTGGCSWMVYVKDGIVTWEMQALDYPMLESSVPPYEPRGCQRGISASWYLYSPIRIKHPYIRGVLLDYWREARALHANPVEAWESIMADEEKRSTIQTARGKGGFRRGDWEEVSEIVAAASLSTARKWGPDRILGFSPIPAMSYLSYAAGSRFLQLMGGVNMSFYDWYADLPNAFPEVWGDQTDVAESADWYKSKYVVSMGANLSMTRTPDVHFIAEARHEGTKFVVLSPDFSQVSKFADWWIPTRAGQDTALWMAVNHVILKEFHADRQVPYFVDYLKRYSDSPFLVRLERDGETFRPSRYLRSNLLTRYADAANGDFKLLVWDEGSSSPRMPKGQVGHRWGEEMGKWNLLMEDAADDSPIDPALSFIDGSDDVLNVEFEDFVSGGGSFRGVPVRYIETSEGPVPVATVYDLLMARFGVDRGLPGDHAASYDDVALYTPAWQEQFTGIGRDTVIQLAREFAANAEVTHGKSSVIIGAGINHWYNSNLAYRAPITALILCGCCGVNGGGMNHYVGQEKLTLQAPWLSVAFALDWQRPPRQAQSPTFHYMNSDQWRYDGEFAEYDSVPSETKWANGHTADLVAKSVRMGWMPSFPQFDHNPLNVAGEAAAAGGPESVAGKVVEDLVSKELGLAVDDPDAPENWPRVWFIWRANAIMSSAKGHEFFLRHYLGTHDNQIAEESAKGKVKTVVWREPAPRGKMDLVVDINFRMDTSALYSDIVLPTASWYEKNDLNSTDMHSFIHPLSAAVPPVWEAKSDWDIFKNLAKKVSELAPDAFDGPVLDVVMRPLSHDTPDELAQTEVLDWREGECDPIPGKTMPHFITVERDYTQIYNKFVSLGPRLRSEGIGANGVHIPMERFYDELLEAPVGGSPDPRRTRCVEWGGNRYPALEDALDAANIILGLAPESNGEVAYEAFLEEEKRIGLPLADLAEGTRSVRMNFADLKTQPRRTLTSPCWTGIVNDGRPYAAWCLNVERLVPWRTLTGRQHLYVDHPFYVDFGENLPAYKPALNKVRMGDLTESAAEPGASLVLKYLTPHGKWHIHSTYSDNLRMLTLSRGLDPCWLNDKDAATIGIADNDWVEVYNDNGSMVTRAAVSSRVQSGTCMIYHAPERTMAMPKSQVRGNKRAGSHNSLTRTRLKPVLLAGGQAQFTYGFNYWGPIGVNRDTHCVIKKLDRLEW
ncbi:MAG: nitrate reductase subunit alpha [Actinomycetes bacterium]